LPKSIRRRGNQGGGAIVGFANLLLRLYEGEKPRAVLVGWDTLDAPTYRHNTLEGYQGGRRFDAELIDQLEMLPEFVAACGFACAKAAGYEADDFLAAAVADEEGRGGTVLVASGDRDAFQLASDKTTILQPTSSPCVAIPRTSCRVPRVSDRSAQRSCCASTARSNRRSKLASWRCRPMNFGFIAGSRR
jgi:DNA polymerase-1